MERAKLTDGSRSKAAQACADGSATVGMLTSNIKNKIVRSEAYTRLKKAKKVCTHVSKQCTLLKCEHASQPCISNCL